MAELLLWIIQLHPAAAPVMGLFSVMGAARAINKPLFTFLHEMVKATATQYDDNLLEQVEKSKSYTGLCYLLDWLGSVKLPSSK